jgi:hypothetical protein
LTARAPEQLLPRPLGAFRRTRGAVFIEALIVCCMLTLMMASGVFFHRLYFTRQKTVGDARAAVWTQALAGCNRGANLDAISQSNGVNAPDITIDTESVPSFFGSVQHTRGSASGSVVAPAQLGNTTYTLAMTTTVACNEIPANKRGDVKSIISYFSSTLIPSFF